MVAGMGRQRASSVRERLDELRGRTRLTLGLSVLAGTGAAVLLAAPALALLAMEWPVILGGTVLLTSSLALLAVWQGMRRRVLDIDAKLNNTPAAPARAPSAPKPSGAKAGGLARRTGIGLGLAGALAAPLAYFAYQDAAPGQAPAVAAKAEAPRAPASAAQPCAYVGEWSATREQGVMRVSLQANGQFSSQPVARGGEFEESVHGSWGVRADRMEWTYAGQSQPREVRRIAAAGIDSFSLKDAEGTLTEYRRIGAAPACELRPVIAAAEPAQETNATSATARATTARTTLQCQMEVNGRYDALLAKNDKGSPAQDLASRRVDELRNCEKLDRQADEKLFEQAYARLTAYLEKLKTDKRLGPEDKAQLEMDYKAVSTARDQDAKRDYLDKAAELYQRLNSGYGKGGGQVYPQLSCADYQAKIRDLTSEDQAAAAELARLKRPDGSLVDPARWTSLSQKKEARRSDLSFFTEGAHANSCKL